ncbi:hypothetical protein BESB_045920 [Besnoitia besnoiti]|uniref:DEAD/DEAH box helicase domain-containing protein n=1 Tax=Besnoitia besnoiti TaxID=94643 RepID=A0A2A9MLP0_BESBE|nr:hypothetical protein BESB_045920 [Besnoitia besnoiti]PFH36400.1 hypothetical protein BESB_045920 [Besnoitia besnoiti]
MLAQISLQRARGGVHILCEAPHEKTAQLRISRRARSGRGRTAKRCRGDFNDVGRCGCLRRKSAKHEAEATTKASALLLGVGSELQKAREQRREEGKERARGAMTGASEPAREGPCRSGRDSNALSHAGHSSSSSSFSASHPLPSVSLSSFSAFRASSAASSAARSSSSVSPFSSSSLSSSSVSPPPLFPAPPASPFLSSFSPAVPGGLRAGRAARLPPGARTDASAAAQTAPTEPRASSSLAAYLEARAKPRVALQPFASAPGTSEAVGRQASPRMSVFPGRRDEETRQAIVPSVAASAEPVPCETPAPRSRAASPSSAASRSSLPFVPRALPQGPASCGGLAGAFTVPLRRRGSAALSAPRAACVGETRASPSSSFAALASKPAAASSAAHPPGHVPPPALGESPLPSPSSRTPSASSASSRTLRAGPAFASTSVSMPPSSPPPQPSPSSPSPHLSLASVLPFPPLVAAYRATRGIAELFPWQFDCLSVTRPASPSEPLGQAPGDSPLNREPQAPGQAEAQRPAAGEPRESRHEEGRGSQLPQKLAAAASPQLREEAPRGGAGCLRSAMPPRGDGRASAESASRRVEAGEGARVLDGSLNLLYSAPTSAGKTLVAEILVFRHVLGLLGEPLRLAKPQTDTLAAPVPEAAGPCRPTRRGEALQQAEGVWGRPREPTRASVRAEACAAPPRRACLIVLPFVALVEEQLRKLQALVAFISAGGGAAPAGGPLAPSATPQQALKVVALHHASPTPLSEEFDIALCTVEKANALIQAALEAGALAEKIGLVVVDELHMVGDAQRGFLLEVFLSKLLCFNCARRNQARLRAGAAAVSPRFWPVQIVGMSATLGNLDEVAFWLGGASFVSAHRPLPLKELYFCWDRADRRPVMHRKPPALSAEPSAPAASPSPSSSVSSSSPASSPPPAVAPWPTAPFPAAAAARAASTSTASRLEAASASRLGVRGRPVAAAVPPAHEDALLALALQRVRRNFSVLIFCSTKLLCERVAASLAPRLETHIAASYFPPAPSAARLSPPVAAPPADAVARARAQRLDFLSRLSAREGGASSLSPGLTSCFLAGVAFHHSGLSAFERSSVERAYREGLLLLLCATSTLAAGVNLPAKRVIFFSPYISRAFLSPGEYQQMAGRAGRVGVVGRGQRTAAAARRRHEAARGVPGQGGGASPEAERRREAAEEAQASDEMEDEELAEEASDEEEGGEAIVLCREAEEEKVKQVMSAGLPVLRSPLAGESHGLQRLLLEALACGGEARLDGLKPEGGALRDASAAGGETVSEARGGGKRPRPGPRAATGDEKDGIEPRETLAREWFGGTCWELVQVASCTLLMIQRHRDAASQALGADAAAHGSLFSYAPSPPPISPSLSAPPRAAAEEAPISPSGASSRAPARAPGARRGSHAAPPRDWLQASPVYQDVRAAMGFLLRRGLARFSPLRDAYEATPRGRAIAASQLSPQEGFLTCALLDLLLDRLILSSDLHLAYLSVPLPLPAAPPSSLTFSVSLPSSSASFRASGGGVGAPSPSEKEAKSRVTDGRPRDAACADIRRGSDAPDAPKEDDEEVSATERDEDAEALERKREALERRQREEKTWRDVERLMRLRREAEEEKAFALAREEVQKLQRVLKQFSPAESFALLQLGLSEADVESLDAPGFLPKNQTPSTRLALFSSPQAAQVSLPPAPPPATPHSPRNITVSLASSRTSAALRASASSLGALRRRRVFVVWRVRQAVALCLLLQGLEPKAVAAALAVSGGVSAVALLHQQATLKATMTAVLCGRLGLWPLAECMRNFQTRIEQSGLSRQLSPLLRLPGVTAPLARLLHEQLGVCTPQQLLAVGALRVTKVLRRRLKLSLGGRPRRTQALQRVEAAREEAAKSRAAPLPGSFSAAAATASGASCSSADSSASSPSSAALVLFFQADRAAAEVTSELFLAARHHLLAEARAARRKTASLLLPSPSPDGETVGLSTSRSRPASSSRAATSTASASVSSFSFALAPAQSSQPSSRESENIVFPPSVSASSAAADAVRPADARPASAPQRPEEAAAYLSLSFSRPSGAAARSFYTSAGCSSLPSSPLQSPAADSSASLSADEASRQSAGSPSSHAPSSPRVASLSLAASSLPSSLRSASSPVCLPLPVESGVPSSVHVASSRGDSVSRAPSTARSAASSSSSLSGPFAPFSAAPGRPPASFLSSSSRPSTDAGGAAALRKDLDGGSARGEERFALKNSEPASPLRGREPEEGLPALRGRKPEKLGKLETPAETRAACGLSQTKKEIHAAASVRAEAGESRPAVDDEDILDAYTDENEEAAAVHQPTREALRRTSEPGRTSHAAKSTETPQRGSPALASGSEGGMLEKEEEESDLEAGGAGVWTRTVREAGDADANLGAFAEASRWRYSPVARERGTEAARARQRLGEVRQTPPVSATPLEASRHIEGARHWRKRGREEAEAAGRAEARSENENGKQLTREALSLALCSLEALKRIAAHWSAAAEARGRRERGGGGGAPRGDAAEGRCRDSPPETDRRAEGNANAGSGTEEGRRGDTQRRSFAAQAGEPRRGDVKKGGGMREAFLPLPTSPETRAEGPRAAFLRRAQAALAEGRVFAVLDGEEALGDGEAEAKTEAFSRGDASHPLPGFCIPEELLLPRLVCRAGHIRESSHAEDRHTQGAFSPVSPSLSSAVHSFSSVHSCYPSDGASRTLFRASVSASGCPPAAGLSPEGLLSLLARSPFVATTVVRERRRRRAELPRVLAPRSPEALRRLLGASALSSRPPRCAASACASSTAAGCSGDAACGASEEGERRGGGGGGACRDRNQEDEELDSLGFSQVVAPSREADVCCSESTAGYESAPVAVCVTSPLFGTFVFPLCLASSSARVDASSSCAAPPSPSSRFRLPPRRVPGILAADRHEWIDFCETLAGAARGGEARDADANCEGEETAEERRDASACGSEIARLRGGRSACKREGSGISFVTFFRRAPFVLDATLPHLMLARRAPAQAIQRARTELAALRKAEGAAGDAEETEVAEGAAGDAEETEAAVLSLWSTKVLVSARACSGSVPRHARELEAFDAWRRRSQPAAQALAQTLLQQRVDREDERQDRRKTKQLGKSILAAVEGNWRRICACAVLNGELQRHGLLEVYVHLETPLARAVSGMRRRGLPISAAFLAGKADHFQRLLRTLQLQICRLSRKSADLLDEETLISLLLHAQQSSHAPLAPASSPLLLSLAFPHLPPASVYPSMRVAEPFRRDGTRGGVSRSVSSRYANEPPNGGVASGAPQDEEAAQAGNEDEASPSAGAARGPAAARRGDDLESSRAEMPKMDAEYGPEALLPSVGERLSNELAALVTSVLRERRMLSAAVAPSTSLAGVSLQSPFDAFEPEDADDLLGMLLRRLDPFSPLAVYLLAYFRVYLHYEAVRSLLADCRRSLTPLILHGPSSPSAPSPPSPPRGSLRESAFALCAGAEPREGRASQKAEDMEAPVQRAGDLKCKILDWRLPVHIHEWSHATGRLLPEHPQPLRRLQSLLPSSPLFSSSSSISSASSCLSSSRCEQTFQFFCLPRERTLQEDFEMLLRAAWAARQRTLVELSGRGASELVACGRRLLPFLLASAGGHSSRESRAASPDRRTPSPLLPPPSLPSPPSCSSLPSRSEARSPSLGAAGTRVSSALCEASPRRSPPAPFLPCPQASPDTAKRLCGAMAATAAELQAVCDAAGRLRAQGARGSGGASCSCETAAVRAQAEAGPEARREVEDAPGLSSFEESETERPQPADRSLSGSLAIQSAWVDPHLAFPLLQASQRQSACPPPQAAARPAGVQLPPHVARHGRAIIHAACGLRDEASGQREAERRAIKPDKDASRCGASSLAHAGEHPRLSSLRSPRLSLGVTPDEIGVAEEAATRAAADADLEEACEAGDAWSEAAGRADVFSFVGIPLLGPERQPFKVYVHPGPPLRPWRALRSRLSSSFLRPRRSSFDASVREDQNDERLTVVPAASSTGGLSAEAAESEREERDLAGSKMAPDEDDADALGVRERCGASPLREASWGEAILLSLSPANPEHAHAHARARRLVAACLALLRLVGDSTTAPGCWEAVASESVRATEAALQQESAKELDSGAGTLCAASAVLRRTGARERDSAAEARGREETWASGGQGGELVARVVFFEDLLALQARLRGYEAAGNPQRVMRLWSARCIYAVPTSRLSRLDAPLVIFPQKKAGQTRVNQHSEADADREGARGSSAEHGLDLRDIVVAAEGRLLMAVEIEHLQLLLFAYLSQYEPLQRLIAALIRGSASSLTSRSPAHCRSSAASRFCNSSPTSFSSTPLASSARVGERKMKTDAWRRLASLLRALLNGRPAAPHRLIFGHGRPEEGGCPKAQSEQEARVAHPAGPADGEEGGEDVSDEDLTALLAHALRHFPSVTSPSLRREENRGSAFESDAGSLARLPSRTSAVDAPRLAGETASPRGASFRRCAFEDAPTCGSPPWGARPLRFLAATLQYLEFDWGRGDPGGRLGGRRLLRKWLQLLRAAEAEVVKCVALAVEQTRGEQRSAEGARVPAASEGREEDTCEWHLAFEETDEPRETAREEGGGRAENEAGADAQARSEEGEGREGGSVSVSRYRLCESRRSGGCESYFSVLPLANGILLEVCERHSAQISAAIRGRVFRALYPLFASAASLLSNPQRDHDAPAVCGDGTSSRQEEEAEKTERNAEGRPAYAFPCEPKRLRARAYFGGSLISATKEELSSAKKNVFGVARAPVPAEKGDTSRGRDGEGEPVARRQKTLVPSQSEAEEPAERGLKWREGEESGSRGTGGNSLDRPHLSENFALVKIRVGRSWRDLGEAQERL